MTWWERHRIRCWGCASLWSEQADEYHLETHATDIVEVIEEDRGVGGVRRISELTEY